MPLLGPNQGRRGRLFHCPVFRSVVDRLDAVPFMAAPCLSALLGPHGWFPSRCETGGCRTHGRFVTIRMRMPFMTLQLIAEPISAREGRLESLIEHRLGNRVRDLRVEVRPAALGPPRGT